MVIGMLCAGSSMLTGGIVRACCVCAAGRGTFGCAGVPGRKVSCAGGTTIFVSFSYPGGAGVSVTSAVSSANPCGPGVSETVVLRFALGLS